MRAANTSARDIFRFFDTSLLGALAWRRIGSEGDFQYARDRQCSTSPGSSRPAP